MVPGYRWLFPDPVRTIPRQRAWNVLFRTAHIATTGILLGGHVLDVEEARVRWALALRIGSGLKLVALEA